MLFSISVTLELKLKFFLCTLMLTFKIFQKVSYKSNYFTDLCIDYSYSYRSSNVISGRDGRGSNWAFGNYY